MEKENLQLLINPLKEKIGAESYVSATAVAFKQESINNIKPVLGRGIKGIYEGFMTTTFSYALMEVILIIHPYVEDKKRIMKASLISAALVIFFIHGLYLPAYYI